MMGEGSELTDVQIVILEAMGRVEERGSAASDIAAEAGSRRSPSPAN
jgi:hypothetical protein